MTLSTSAPSGRSAAPIPNPFVASSPASPKRSNRPSFSSASSAPLLNSSSSRPTASSSGPASSTHPPPATSSASPRGSHPAHPGPISIPPPPPVSAFPLYSPGQPHPHQHPLSPTGHPMSPVSVIYPGYSPYGPMSPVHQHPYAMPAHVHSNMTPHGLPPITPSMPSFSPAVPGWAWLLPAGVDAREFGPRERDPPRREHDVRGGPRRPAGARAERLGLGRVGADEQRARARRAGVPRAELELRRDVMAVERGERRQRHGPLRVAQRPRERPGLRAARVPAEGQEAEGPGRLGRARVGGGVPRGRAAARVVVVLRGGGGGRGRVPRGRAPPRDAAEDALGRDRRSCPAGTLLHSLDFPRFLSGIQHTHQQSKAINATSSSKSRCRSRSVSHPVSGLCFSIYLFPVKKGLSSSLSL
ncbi:hypothetical protein DFH11DRAFT_1598166 [Phellopilus nigrolimitatus]|nr:hypothetical protein DFH11DRAFT_1598166 [Phellopilus nigrolimitatus]